MCLTTIKEGGSQTIQHSSVGILLWNHQIKKIIDVAIFLILLRVVTIVHCSDAQEKSQFIIVHR